MTRLAIIGAGLLASLAGPIHAGEHYRFRVGEGLEALGAEKLPAGMEQLRGRPLMILIGIEGTHWRWVLNGCPASKRCEFRIDDRGGTAHSAEPDEDPAAFTRPRDLGLLRIDSKRFQLRCLRESCVIRHGAAGAEEVERIRLLRGEWIELSVEREIDVTLSADAKP
jgi:hypothetical protein